MESDEEMLIINEDKLTYEDASTIFEAPWEIQYDHETDDDINRIYILRCANSDENYFAARDLYEYALM